MSMEDAIYENNIQLVAELLECDKKSITQNVYGFDPLKLAVMSYKDDIVDLLIRLSYTININEKDNGGSTPLILACIVVPDSQDDILRNLRIIKLLLNAGANIDDQNIQGNTALHLAIINNYEEAVKILVSYKPNLEILNHNGDTPFMICYKNLSPLGKYVIHDINNFNNSKNILRDCILDASVEEVSYLLELGSDPNSVYDDMTNLAKAIYLRNRYKEFEQNFYVIIDLLLSYGARKDIFYSKKTSPVDLAKKFKDNKILELLSKY
jgi:ankyrin repeat protein